LDGENLTASMYASEASLWTRWRHRGNLKANGDTNECVIVLNDRFGEVMGLHPKPWTYAKRYAEQFLRNLNKMENGELSDVLKTAESAIQTHDTNISSVP